MKKNRKELQNIKKKINELFLLGDVTEETARQIETEAEKAINDEAGTSSDSKVAPAVKDISMMVSRKLNSARLQKQQGPQLTLTLEKLGGVYMSHPEIRDLVQFSVVGSVVNKPKWAHFRPWKSTTQTVVIRVNCTPDYIENNEYSFKFIDQFFNREWIRMDSDVGNRDEFWKHMVESPVSIQEQIRERVNKMEPLEDLIKKGGLKTELLATSVDMVDSNYPFPDGEFVPTKDKYAPVTNESPIFGLDCEMCITTAGIHELTRISLIREDGSVVLDSLVKPFNEIKDYLTKFSGITEEMMKDVTVTIPDVQKAIRAVLPSDAILCGHSLEFDLRAMKMAHPYCIDVGHIFNLSGSNKSKTSLKTLIQLFFDEEIQSSHGHCSVEDSYAALKLIALKMDKGLIFGNCRFGWDYDSWSREKRKLREEREKEEEKEEEDDDLLPAKRRKMATVVKVLPICGCGSSIGILCILEGCKCQVNPPTKCIKCLAAQVVEANEKDLFCWSSALRIDMSTKTRPISYFLNGGKKTVLVGFDEIADYEIHPSKLYSFKPPSTHPSLTDYVDEVVCDLMNHSLALIELDYQKRPLELSAASSTEEDGELPAVWSEIVDEIDGDVEKIIRGAAKNSLIIVVLASPTASVCYLKVK